MAFVAGPLLAAENRLIIFSWWTNGGEADGLNALFGEFKKRSPGTEIVNATVAGGAGVNAKAVLKTRMLGGDPPDSFQVHGGSELVDTWVKTGYMEPLTAVWKKNGWDKAFPKDLIDMVTYQGEIYSVPVNVHRGNVLWYNVSVLRRAGLQPPTTFDDFFAAARKLKGAGVVPLSLASKDKWAVAHLFEDILLGVGGPRFYRDLMGGKIPWTDARVKRALEIVKEMLEYVNTDHAAITWDQASAYVLSGKAAMNVMGDWAKGYFTANGAKPEVDFGGIPSPNTAGNFMVVTDTFGLPKKAPNRSNALTWLEIAGSKEGQTAFNPLKGSIPARTDVTRQPYDTISLRFMDDFARNALVPSAAHGSAVTDAFATALNDELALFAAEGNVEATARRLEQQAQDLGVRK